MRGRSFDEAIFVLDVSVVRCVPSCASCPEPVSGWEKTSCKAAEGSIALLGSDLAWPKNT